jgi:hypothetical protein
MHESQQTPCLVRCGAPDDSRRHADRVGGRPEEAKKKPANAEQHEEESEEKADGERAPSEPLYDEDYDDDEETLSWGEEEEKQEDKQKVNVRAQHGMRPLVEAVRDHDPRDGEDTNGSLCAAVLHVHCRSLPEYPGERVPAWFFDEHNKTN